MKLHHLFPQRDIPQICHGPQVLSILVSINLA